MWAVFAHGVVEGTQRLLELGKVGEVDLCGLAHKTGRVERQVFLVRLGQSSLLSQSLVHTLTDSAVGAIGSDKNVSLIGVVVSSLDLDSLLLLRDGEDALAEVDLFCGDQLQQEIVEQWARYNVAVVSSAICVQRDDMTVVSDDFLISSVTIAIQLRQA